MKKWLYKNFGQLYKPSTIIFTYKFYGKGSNDCLYEVDESMNFELPLKIDYVSDDENWDYPARRRVKDAYDSFIKKKEKQHLENARKEKYISLEDEERITGDYIVSVKCNILICWSKLSYEEYHELKEEKK